MDRRRFLASGAAGLAIGLAGCLDSVTGVLGEDESWADLNPVALGGLHLINSTAEPQEVEYRVEREGEIVHSGTSHLAAYPSGDHFEYIPCEWESEGRFRIHYQRDLDGEWNNLDMRSSSEECVIVRFNVMTDTNGEDFISNPPNIRCEKHPADIEWCDR